MIQSKHFKQKCGNAYASSGVCSYPKKSLNINL